MRTIRVLLCGALAAVLLSFPTAAQEQVPFRAESDLVSVYATVVGKDGRLVTTLTKDDFQLRDEGKPQPIVLFDNSPRPIRMVALFDVSGSMVGNLPLLREGAKQLFARLGPDDRVRVGTFGNTVTISESFTRDQRQLEAALPTEISQSAPTPLWRAIDKALDVLKEPAGTERPVIVVLSDGKDSGPMGLGWGDRMISQVEIMDRARDEDVMVYAVAMRSRSAAPAVGGFGMGNMQAAMAADLPDPGLARVAEESGGGFIEINFRQNLGESFMHVVDELHSQYLLGFAPPTRDGKAHDVDVRVLQKDMKTRARKSYRAPKDAR